jgi:hypothetical protein
VRPSVNAIEHPIGNRIAAVLILAFFRAECGAAAEKFQRLSGPQIRAKFTGMEMTDSVHFADMFAARTGKWRIEDDELCVELAEEAESGCYEVWPAGTKVELRPSGHGLVVQGVLRRPEGRASRK